jgi:ATP-dependent helicase/nuclease subunit A
MTDAQARQRIETELDQNLLVEASAGSGKTESLARRMAQGLKRGVYQVEHLAAVTFTKQAASELRGRLQLRLEEALKQEVEFRPNVERALSRLEHLFAGTIHGFCGRVRRSAHPGASPLSRQPVRAADPARAGIGRARSRVGL